jgi:hypothetical protein
VFSKLTVPQDWGSPVPSWTFRTIAYIGCQEYDLPMSNGAHSPAGKKLMLGAIIAVIAFDMATFALAGRLFIDTECSLRNTWSVVQGTGPSENEFASKLIFKRTEAT